MKLGILLSRLYDESGFSRFRRSEKNACKRELLSLEIKCFKCDLPELLCEEISGIVFDSRCAVGGSVFFALKGEKYDGNDFVQEAVTRGARVVVSERVNLELSRGMLIIVKNARKFMAEIARAFYDFPDKRMLTVGVTGTKGKSTVVELARGILERLGYSVLSSSTLGIGGIGRAGIECINTTPDAVSIFSLLSEAYQRGIRIAIIEVSSQALKAYRSYGLEFDIAVFTSLSRDHIGDGEHETLADYIACKRRLFTATRPCTCIVNSDDAYASYFSAGIKRRIRCGSMRYSDIRISDFSSSFDGMSFRLSGHEVSTPLVGEYNAVNIALAVALVREVCGRELREIIQPIATLSVKGRFEHCVIDGRDIIIDYAHNAKSFRELISLVKKLTRGRIIVVFGSVGKRCYERRRELAEAAEELADFSFITSDNPGEESPMEIAREILSAYKDKSHAQIVLMRDEAIRRALDYSSFGDAVLLLGKGHEEYMTTSEGRVKFSERETLLDYMKSKRS